MRSAAFVLLLALAGCSAVPPPPAGTDYARVLLARPVPREVGEAPPARQPVTAPASPTTTASADAMDLDELLARRFDADELAAVAVQRSGETAAARAGVEVVRTGYRQSEDLADLVAIHRSFTRDLETRVGPPLNDRPTATIAPSPNVAALSGEIVRTNVDLAKERLRTVELRIAADAWRLHAEVAEWAQTRRIVAEDLRLMEGLLTVLRARLETGQANQAGYLAFSAAIARRRTELEVLGDKAPSLRTRLNRLLARPENAVVNLDLVPTGSDPLPSDESALVARALDRSPVARSAALRAERADLAVRLAETMTLSRFDLGSARFERERVGEAGLERGPVFPDPGRMTMARPDFGIREAQVHEMRARAAGFVAEADDARRQTAAAVRTALYRVTAAEKRRATLENDVVPLADRALRAVRGAYEGSRAGYLDLLEAARNRLRARLDRAGAVRDLSGARADLLVAAGFDPEKETDR